MKAKLLSLILFFAALPQAQAVEVYWRGNAHIWTSSGSCARQYDAGQTYEVRFQPAGIGTNGRLTRMAWFFGNQAAHAFVAPIMDATWRQMEYNVIFSGTYPAITAPALLRFYTQSPAVINERTQFIEINGQIQHFNLTPNCLVTFRMGLTLSSRL